MTQEIYLSGEIHSDWREQIVSASESHGLPFTFTYPVTDHEASDAAGDVLGEQSEPFWRDHQSAKINSIRSRRCIQQCDLAIIRFGPKFKQWNVAFEAGYCAALGKPFITFHDEDLVHPLKEVDAAAIGWGKSIEQLVEILRYLARDL
jgi:YtoQ family protein